MSGRFSKIGLYAMHTANVNTRHWLRTWGQLAVLNTLNYSLSKVMLRAFWKLRPKLKTVSEVKAILEKILINLSWVQLTILPQVLERGWGVHGAHEGWWRTFWAYAV